MTILCITGNPYGQIGGAALARSFLHLPCLSGRHEYPSTLPLHAIMDLAGCAAWRDEWAVLWADGDTDSEGDSYRACLAAWLHEHAWLQRRQLVAFRTACCHASGLGNASRLSVAA
jgi:hypothetical protein